MIAGTRAGGVAPGREDSTGQSFPRLALPAAALERADLESRAPASLAGGVEGLPGARAQGQNDRPARLVIRGMGGARVLVLDGPFPVYDFRYTGVDGPTLTLPFASRVEVIRGPQSVLFGSDALAGVVRVTPAEIEAASPGQSRFHLGGEVYGASGDGGAGGAVRMAGARGGFGWRLSGAGRRSDDLETPSARIDPSSFGAADAEAGLRLAASRGSAKVRFVRSTGRFDAALGPGGVSGRSGLRSELSDQRLHWRGSYPWPGVELQVRGQWQRRRLETRWLDGSRSPFSRLMNAYALELQGVRTDGPWSGAGGVSGLAMASESRDPTPLVPDTRLISGAVFAIERLRRPRWTLVAAARLDLRHLEAAHSPALALAEQSRGFQVWSGAAGATYHPSESWALSLDLARAFRDPTPVELYARGRPLDRDRYEIGWRALRPERGLGLDAGVRWKWRRVRSEVAAFRERVRDWIDLEATGEVRDSLSVYRYGAHRADLMGGEASVEFEASRILSLACRLEHVRGDDPDLHRPLASIPPARWGLEATLHRSVLRGAANAALRVEAEGRARKQRPAPLDGAADGYWTAALDAELSLERSGGTVRIGVRAANLANARYRDFLARDAATAAGQGRRLVVRMSWDR